VRALGSPADRRQNLKSAQGQPQIGGSSRINSTQWNRASHGQHFYGAGSAGVSAV
jgi:hypothetical protein